MKENVQVIEKDGKPEWAIIPYETYIKLVEEAEMLQDIRDYDSVKAAIERGEEELIPGEVVYAILDGENPIKVWREYRGLSQQQVANMIGISTSYLSQIEAGKRTGSTEVLAAIAKALDVTLDDIVGS
jgi:DNA-binding XRE family transcriptional regulator